MSKIVFEYAEDCRNLKKTSKIYSIIRDYGFDPITSVFSHQTNTGEARLELYFNNELLPSESKLVERLKDLNLKSIRVKEDSKEKKPVRPYEIKL